MAFLQSVRLEIRDDSVGFEVASKNVLNVFEGSVLSHAVRHIFGGVEQAVEVLTEFARLPAEYEDQRETLKGE